MKGQCVRAALLAASTMLLASAPVASAQTGTYTSYADYDAMTRALRSVTRAAGEVAAMESMGKTAEGRDIWLITIGKPDDKVDQRPAVLVTAGLEANHLIGSMTALYLADYLASGYGKDPAVTALLDANTYYIFPRLNPDGAERFFTSKGIEFVTKPDPEDEDRDGRADEDGGDDLNGDGFVTMMRVRDPEGVWIPDPDDPRLMRRADRTRGERGIYTLYTEGKDDDGDGALNEDGPGGTNLDRNWPHQYDYYADHVGRNQVSETENRALADFAFTHPNIVFALSFTPYDNLLTAPQSRPSAASAPSAPSMASFGGGRSGAGPPAGFDISAFMRTRTAPTSILSQDVPYFAAVAAKFGEMTGLSGNGASGEAGSWPQMAYYQLGFWSFTTPVWTLPQEDRGAARSGMPGGRAARSGASAGDAAWLSWFEQSGVKGFVDWTPVNHPTLGEVEVGGFIPNVRTNPPAAQIAELAKKHAEFAAWLPSQAPRVTLTDVSIEGRGDGVFLVSATVQNDGYLPTDSAMALQARVSHPLVLRLLPARGVKVLTGDPQQQVRSLAGSGGRETIQWLVSARSGTTVTLELLAQQAGGLTTRTLTLRQEDLR